MIHEVQRQFPDVGFMKLSQAEVLRGLVRDRELRSLLEIGTYKGKGTAFLAAILEERGGPGMITSLDRSSCLKNQPNAFEVLKTLNLSHRANIILDHRSFTNSLRTMLISSPKVEFDFCYFDAGHVWDTTGFAFFLIDKLLKPGGWVVLDDLDWTIAGSPTFSKSPKAFLAYSDEEKNMPQVRQVWDILVRGAGYIQMQEISGGWGMAQKPPKP